MSVHTDEQIIRKFDEALAELLTLRQPIRKRILTEKLDKILGEFEVMVKWEIK